MDKNEIQKFGNLIILYWFECYLTWYVSLCSSNFGTIICNFLKNFYHIYFDSGNPSNSHIIDFQIHYCENNISILIYLFNII